jgi:cell division protein FtsW
MPSAAALHLRVVDRDEVPPAVAQAMAERGVRRTLAVLAASTALLTGLGLIMVLSASSVSAFAAFGSSFLYFKRQLLYAGIGTVLALLAARMRYRTWQRAWPAMLAVTLVLLAMVLHPSVGTVAGGSARWIDLGAFSMQPSEGAKFVVVCAAAAILAANLKYLDETIRWAVPLGLILGALSILILLQPDLGTLTVIAVTVFLMLFVAGVRLRTLVLSFLATSAVGLSVIMSQRYMRIRLLSFLHPWADPRNSGYQLIQSLIALGSGHLFGVGLGASRQKWMYVPNAHTDFIFSIMGEELGLIGEIIVLGLFGALLYAGVRIALRAPDPFGRLLAAGITAWFGVQALVNLGGATGVLPITGVPLPFISFGGSSLVVSMAAVGVLLSIGRAELASVRTGPRPRSGRAARGR